MTAVVTAVVTAAVTETMEMSQLTTMITFAVLPSTHHFQISRQDNELRKRRKRRESRERRKRPWRRQLQILTPDDGGGGVDSGGDDELTVAVTFQFTR